MHQPLVSLITVVFNGQELLAETLRSAINQTYKQIELVIIDGGSKDESVAVAQQFSAHIGTLISEKDKGIYDAMNKGIKAAKGEWVYFLNVGDAFYDTNVLEDIFSKDLSAVDLIYGKVQTINEPTGINYITGAEVSINDFYKRFPVCHQATFTRKAAFEKLGDYDLRYKMVADHQWFVRFFKASPERALFTDRIIAFYDIQGSSYHKRMQSQQELLDYGRELFPAAVWLTNYISYPLVYVKVWVIRTFQQTAWFKAYRKRKFQRSKLQQQLPV
jgi:glycosyltransferase involved in cell wall biosynthesis